MRKGKASVMERNEERKKGEKQKEFPLRPASGRQIKIN
jgi:hypothetical protein